jgi:hypothetical protein
MNRDVVLASADRVRAAIAHAVLTSAPAFGGLGHIELQAHQISAVSRLRHSIDEFGGALLCDPVGTGKTYIALALAPPDGLTLVVAPAVLKDMWLRAAAMADRRIAFLSFESLSRGKDSTPGQSFLVVDEAHHARNPSTRRYEMLSRLASRSDVILLTATPVHNRRVDFSSLLALFLGARGESLKLAELARCVIRREASANPVTGIPRADPITWCRVGERGDVLQMLLSLPPPVSPRDGGDGGTLVIHSLVRQWASSDAALRGALRRRLVRAQSLMDALAKGTWPSRSELMTWIAGEDTVQLSFAELLSPVVANSEALLPAVSLHCDALKKILAVFSDGQTDDERAALIRRVRKTHRDRRIVVFSQYADTIHRMFALLAPDGGVAALTGSGARVAGGIISRGDAIGRFAPVASGCAPSRPANDVSLLLATDLLSEGVNLQDAGVVVHLDLPWTPARMEQRLGRIARIGSPHDHVVSYAIRPHVSANEVIRLEEILTNKSRAAGSVRREPAIAESIRRSLEPWLRPETEAQAFTLATTVAARIDGFVAVCDVEGEAKLVASMEDLVSDDPDHVSRCLASCCGDELRTAGEKVTVELERIEAWLQSTRALGHVMTFRAAAADNRKPALRRIDRVIRSARRHERARLNEIANRAREVVTSNLGIFLEHELVRVTTTVESDSGFLSAVIALGNTRARRIRASSKDATGYHVRALVLLCRQQCVDAGKGTLTSN